mmetsp:Transcript_3809/g.11837  ORF Transcript_3809/g.11837 Transcript_3809/m.11837 type:complete len:316 (-) Transcript_3809:354-1301(-)
MVPGCTFHLIAFVGKEEVKKNDGVVLVLRGRQEHQGGTVDGGAAATEGGGGGGAADRDREERRRKVGRRLDGGADGAEGDDGCGDAGEGGGDGGGGGEEGRRDERERADGGGPAELADFEVAGGNCGARRRNAAKDAPEVAAAGRHEGVSGRSGNGRDVEGRRDAEEAFVSRRPEAENHCRVGRRTSIGLEGPEGLVEELVRQERQGRRPQGSQGSAPRHCSGPGNGRAAETTQGHGRHDDSPPLRRRLQDRQEGLLPHPPRQDPRLRDRRPRRSHQARRRLFLPRRQIPGRRPTSRVILSSPVFSLVVAAALSR